MAKKKALRARPRIASAVFSMKQLFDTVGVDTPDEVFEDYFDDAAWEYAYREAIRDGKSETEAEELGSEAAGDSLSDAWTKYERVAFSAIADLFREAADLDVDEHIDPDFGRVFHITPRNSWTKSAEAIREIVNGMGYFHFDSLAEFRRSGPYTDREIVLSHIGYIGNYPTVFGGSSPSNVIERRLRYY